MIKQKSRSNILLSYGNKKSDYQLSKSQKAKKSSERSEKQLKKSFKNLERPIKKDKNSQNRKQKFDQIIQIKFEVENQTDLIRQRSKSIKLIQRPISRLSTRRGSMISSQSHKQGVNYNSNSNRCMKENNQNLINLNKQIKQIKKKQQKQLPQSKKRIKHKQKQTKNTKKCNKQQQTVLKQCSKSKQGKKQKSIQNKIPQKKIKNPNKKIKLQIFEQKLSKCLDQMDIFSPQFYAQSKKQSQNDKKLSKSKSKSKEKISSKDCSSKQKQKIIKDEKKDDLFKVYEFYKQTFDINLKKCMQMNKNNNEKKGLESYSKNSLLPSSSSTLGLSLKKHQIKNSFEAQFGIIKHSVNNTTNFKQLLFLYILFSSKLSFEVQNRINAGSRQNVSKDTSSQYELITLKQSSVEQKLKKQIQLSKSKSSKKRSKQSFEKKLSSSTKSKQIPCCKISKFKYFNSVDMDVDIDLKQFSPQKSNQLRRKRKSSKDLIVYNEKDELSLGKIQIGQSNINVLKWWHLKDNHKQKVDQQENKNYIKKLLIEDIEYIYKPTLQEVDMKCEFRQINEQNSVYQEKTLKGREFQAIQQTNADFKIDLIQSDYTVKNNEAVVYKQIKEIDQQKIELIIINNTEINSNIKKKQQESQQDILNNCESFCLEELSAIDVFELNGSVKIRKSQMESHKDSNYKVKINNLVMDLQIDDFQL